MRYRINVKEPRQWHTSTVIFLCIIIFCLAFSLMMSLPSVTKRNPVLTCREYHYDGTNKICHIPEEQLR